MKSNLRRFIIQFISLSKALFWTIQFQILAGKKDLNKKNLLFLFRNETWISWGLLLAFGLIKEKQNVIIVYSETDIKKSFPFTHVILRFIIRSIALELVKIDDVDLVQNTILPKNIIHRQIAYDYRIEEIKVEFLSEYDLLFRKYTRENQIMISVLQDLNKRHQINNMFVFSGIISTTSAVLYFGQENKIRTVTFEGWSWKPGLMMYAVNRPAVEFKFRERFEADYKTNREDLINFYTDYESFINGYDVRGWFKSFYNIQSKVSINNVPEKFINWESENASNTTVLLATNMVGDSATLGREKFFKSQEEWLRYTLNYLITSTNHRIIVRIHPAEEWKKSKLKFSLGSVLMEFESHFYKRIYPIQAIDKFNTLSLANRTDCIIVWTSSIGADFAARGKLVINTAIGNYEDFEFSISPTTLLDYNTVLDEIAILANSYKNNSIKQAQAQGYFYYLLKANAYKVFGNGYNLSGATLDKNLSQFINLIQE